MAISGKVTASTVAASLTTVVSGILAPHIFWTSVPDDVKGLVEAGVTAVITFASGYLAKHGVAYEAAAKDAVSLAVDFGVPFSSIPEAPEVLAALDVPVPAPFPAPPAVPHPLSVAQPIAVAAPLTVAQPLP